MTPETLTFTEFARLQGVRPSYVTKLKDHGRLVLTEDGKRVRVAESIALIEQTAGGRIDVSARHAAARAAGGDNAAPDRSVVAGGQKNAASAQSDVRGVADVRLVDAKLRKESAQADQEEMKAAQMRGELIPREDVEAAMKFIGGAVRSALEVFPDQNAPLLAPLSDLAETHEALTQACRDALHSVGEAIDRQKKQLERSSD